MGYIVYIPISTHGTILLLNRKWSWHFTMGWGMHYNMHMCIVCCNEVIHRLHNTSRGDEGHFWNQNERNECQLKDHCVACVIHLQINFIYLCIKWQNIFHHNFYATLTFATFSNFIVGDILLVFLTTNQSQRPLFYVLWHQSHVIIL